MNLLQHERWKCITSSPLDSSVSERRKYKLKLFQIAENWICISTFKKAKALTSRWSRKEVLQAALLFWKGKITSKYFLNSINLRNKFHMQIYSLLQFQVKHLNLEGCGPEGNTLQYFSSDKLCITLCLAWLCVKPALWCLCSPKHQEKKIRLDF